MKQIEFKYIETKCEDCMYVFYIHKNIMFVLSNYLTAKQCITCGYDEDWINIIKDRGDWQYFHEKFAKTKYHKGNRSSENERKCFEQMINIIRTER